MSTHVFWVQTGISVSVIGFCIGMLASGQDTGTYLPVLTGIVGYWLPAPTRPIADPAVLPEPSANV